MDSEVVILKKDYDKSYIQELVAKMPLYKINLFELFSENEKERN